MSASMLALAADPTDPDLPKPGPFGYLVLVDGDHAMVALNDDPDHSYELVEPLRIDLDSERGYVALVRSPERHGELVVVELGSAYTFLSRQSAWSFALQHQAAVERRTKAPKVCCVEVHPDGGYRIDSPTPNCPNRPTYRSLTLDRYCAEHARDIMDGEDAPEAAMWGGPLGTWVTSIPDDGTP